jgi:hypothetical protein
MICRRFGKSRFKNLREWVGWLLDYGKTANCCRFAEDEELKEQPELFDCTACEFQAKCDRLWPENAEAWQVHQTLCGRSVTTLEIRGDLFWKLTEGWTFRDQMDLLARLDCIADMVSPRDGESNSDGSPPARHLD